MKSPPTETTYNIRAQLQSRQAQLQVEDELQNVSLVHNESEELITDYNNCCARGF